MNDIEVLLISSVFPRAAAHLCEDIFWRWIYFCTLCVVCLGHRCAAALLQAVTQRNYYTRLKLVFELIAPWQHTNNSSWLDRMNSKMFDRVELIYSRNFDIIMAIQHWNGFLGSLMWLANRWDVCFVIGGTQYNAITAEIISFRLDQLDFWQYQFFRSSRKKMRIK